MSATALAPAVSLVAVPDVFYPDFACLVINRIEDPVVTDPDAADARHPD